MKVDNKHFRTVWMESNSVFLIEQNLLPFKFEIFESKSYKQTCTAIREMLVRGAGAIGTAAGFAMAQAFLQAPTLGFWEFIESAKKEIESTRPTAQNLFHATETILEAAKQSDNPVKTAVQLAQTLADNDVEACRKIGEFGHELIKNNMKILTHCNAGWLAFTDFGSALSPVFRAHNSDKNVFVFVDETRPRAQGARLTAWELQNADIPHAIIPDNAAAHLMQQGKIDLVIVGADRIAANGDVANKIGTLEKAICAREFGIPFYVAAPLSTIDTNCLTGNDIPIEVRSQSEVFMQTGLDEKGDMHKIFVCSPGSEAYNPAFDVTPAKFISGYITEKGIFKHVSQILSASNTDIYEGVKFETIFLKSSPPFHRKITELKKWCQIFHEQNLAPPYPGGSFGNLSFKTENDTFIITGSRIGLKNALTDDCFVEVFECNFDNTTIEVVGTREPSSETMLHAAIYQSRPDVRSIFHGHSPELLLHSQKLQIPETKEEKPYGTMELVSAVLKTIDRSDMIIMKNHGFIAVGKTMSETGELLLRQLEKIRPSRDNVSEKI